MPISIAHQSYSRPTTSAADRSARFERQTLPLRQELERAAYRYTRNVHDAEDLLQETFVKAWAGYGSFDPDTNLRAWMFRIMVNTWISSHRRTERRPKEALTDSFTDAQLGAQSARSAGLPSAEAQALQRMPNDRIRNALQTLPRDLQAIVYYAYVCQFAYKEIAAIEGIPVGTVMSRVHRARRQLRVALCDVAAEHGYAHGVPCGVAA
jgi:RNA polymerase sigma-70 factor (ECF subfamily)